MTRDLRHAGWLGAAIMGSRVLGLVREMVLSALFGARAVADAFQVAFTIPNLLRDLLAEGALSSAFVPTFTEALEHRGREGAYRLGNFVLSAMLIVTGLLTVAGMVWSEAIVTLVAGGFGGDASKVALTAELTRVMMPILALVSLGAVWMGMLNAQRRFVAPALAPAVFNLVSIATAVVVWISGKTAETGIAIWATGTLLAGVVQAGMQLAALLRLGYRPALLVRGLVRDPGVRRIAALMAPALVGVAAVQINIFVNTRFAGELGDGAVSQLRYAFRVFFLPLGMFGVALGTVATTSVSEAAAKKDLPLLARATADSMGAAWMLTSASAVGMWILAEPIVTLLFRYGRTTGEDAIAIAACLQAYALGLVPYSLIKIAAPAYYSIDRPRIPLVASIVGVAASVVWNTFTHERLGAPGIAFGTSLGAAINMAMLRLAFGRAIAPLPALGGRRIAALVLANAVMGAFVYGAWLGAAWLLRTGAFAWGTRLATAILLGAVIAIAFVMFVAVLRVCGYPGSALLASLPGKLVRRIARMGTNRPRATPPA